MDDYRQPDTPETANEVEMLLDQQAEQAVSNEASKETSADMKAEPVNLEEIVQPKEQLEEVKEQPEELMEEAQEQPEESELTELTKEQPEESEQAELKEKQLDELDAASTEESQEGSMELSMEPSMESSMEVEAKPEDEATREAQSSVFGQAVTLDAIHDSELIKTVNRAKQLLNDLDEAEKDKTRLTGELKQSEKAYSSMEKSVAEGITTALKKKKEEIKLYYNRKIQDIKPLNNLVNNDESFVSLKMFSGLEYEKIVGCYIIHNKENDKYYVGQSKDILKRLKQHFKGTVPLNPIFAEDYYNSQYPNKDDLFEVKIIRCNTKDELDNTEKQLISDYDSWKNGYNGTSGNI